ncbi:hypothetical protein [Streptomyces celluloflavus]|uniref:hypothetical protein n=1 Tax=Streptomyces celluloflavus TaxID=58344 RepID=UPI00367DD4D2
MAKLWLSLHVLSAILLIGPMTVAASLLPGRVRAALTEGAGAADPPARWLHRTCRVYAVLGLAVPAFGLVTAARMGNLTDLWLIVSLGLTLAAGVLLAAWILPAQARALALLDTGSGADAPAAATSQTAPGQLTRLSIVTGIFALLWAVVVVLMIVRPGSTTGA